MCSDDTLYTGIATDVAQRFYSHERKRGAKYFRARRPLRVVYAEGGHDRRSAAKREWQIKRMSRADKCKLIETAGDERLIARSEREKKPADVSAGFLQNEVSG